MKKTGIVMVLLLGIVLVSSFACGGGEELVTTPTPTLTAVDGHTVKVDYTGTLNNGTVFDSSVDPSFGHVEPIQFTIGEGRVLPGFEQAIIGMSPGESKTVQIPADEAYGPKTPENTHPLAGEDLNFEITLLEILVMSVDDDPALGPEDARVTIIQFSDFQCPLSKRYFYETEQLILSAYGDQVRYVFRDFPLTSIHPQAQKAAEAAQCAFNQGRFWEYHDMLFQNQGALDVDSLKSYAAALGLDQTAFNRCLDSGKYAEEVEKDIEDARSYGVTGTPIFFINGRKVVGALPYDTFQIVIEEELSKTTSGQ